MCSLIFSFLKDRVKHKKIYIQIRESKNKRVEKKYLHSWKKLALVSKGTNAIKTWFYKSLFSALSDNSELNLKSEKLSNFLVENSFHNFYRQLRISFNMDKAEEQKNYGKVLKNIIFPSNFKTLWKYGLN